MLSLLDIPIEILLNVFALLPLPDCKNVRLACQRLTQAAEVYIYQKIILYPNFGSFCKLTFISNHPRHCRYVRTLAYVGNGYLMHAPNNTPIEQISKNEAAIDDMDDPYASVFTQMINDGILKEGHEIRLLSAALASFASLHAIQLRLNVETNENDCDISFRGFGAILSAAGRLSTQLSTIRAKVNTEVFNCTFPLFPTIQESMKCIRHLRLECHLLSGYRWRFNSHRGLAIAIRSATCLATLEITSRHYLIDLSEIFPTSATNCCSWPNLAHLKLDGFRTLEESLRALLITHASTLKSLVLNDLAFVPKAFDKDGPPSISLWISLIHFLQQSLDLEKVSLMGAERTRCLGSRVYAGPDWISNFSPVIKRLEKYIIHRGEYPQALINLI